MGYNEALRQKLITLIAYIKKSEISQINNLMMYLLPWEKRTSQTAVQQIEVVKIREETNKVEMKKYEETYKE